MAKSTTESTKNKAKQTSKTNVKADSEKNTKKEPKPSKSKLATKTPSKVKNDVVKKETKNTKTRTTTKRTNNKKTTTSNTNNFLVEYYDLPYKYNQTIVKILAQTPTTLFVYWEVSDADRKRFIDTFGEKFFNCSKPVLIIHNLTKQTNYEVEINDFANSWYLKMIEPNCNYKIELGRRIFDINKLNNKTNESHYNNQYISIINSNNLETPNDHVLLENIYSGTKIQFKNVKTNEITIKEYGTLTFMPNIYKIFDFYKTIYKNEIMEDSNKTILSNPSSSSFFK